MTRFISLLTALTLFLLLTTHSYADDKRSEVRVAKIEVDIKLKTPNTSITPQIVLKRLKTKEGAVFSQIDFDEDLKTLANEYDNVEPELSFKGNQVYITLNIYPKLVIRHITWHGNNTIKTKCLVKELEIECGSSFDRYTFNEAFHKLRAYYIKEGFFEAELDYRIHPDPCTNEVDIEICIKEGPAGRIQKICFEGLNECEENKILDLMVTKEYCLFTSWYTKSGTFHPEALDHDKLIITNYLQNEGYADARVSITACESGETDRIIVKVCADKGARYYFGNVTFCGNEIFCDEVIWNHVEELQGMPFSADNIREAVHCLTTLYGSKGYIEACINFTPKLRPDCNVYDVHFDIEEGYQYRVGLVKVFGNSYTKTNVILHESLMCPGDVFDSRKLEGTECRLQKIGYFECVNVYPVKSSNPPDGCERYRDVHIEVKEACTGTFGVFFGFSTIDSLFGGIEITERNFNHEGLKDLGTDKPCCLRGNGEFLQLRTSVGIKNSSYLLRWTKPYFLDTRWTLGFDVEHTNNRAVSDDYDLISTAFKIHATYCINDFLRYGWTYRLQKSNVHTYASSEETQNEERKNGTISALGPTITYDSTDCAHRPTKGFRSSLGLEYAGLGGTATFFSASYLNTYYYPISSRGTMKYRCDLQFIDPLGNTTIEDLPLGERLFLGGENTVRGYRAYSIGPRFRDTSDPAGGISSFLISEEYLHRIYKRIDAFAFLDGGSVTDERFTIGTIRFSYGIGLRVEVMEGMPVIVGMGFPINPGDTSTRKFFLSFGGRF